jgi:hypothetical protein
MRVRLAGVPGAVAVSDVRSTVGGLGGRSGGAGAAWVAGGRLLGTAKLPPGLDWDCCTFALLLLLLLLLLRLAGKIEIEEFIDRDSGMTGAGGVLRAEALDSLDLDLLDVVTVIPRFANNDATFALAPVFCVAFFAASADGFTLNVISFVSCTMVLAGFSGAAGGTVAEPCTL